MEDDKSGVNVILVDPFFENNPFFERDNIISIDGKIVNNKGSFESIVSDLIEHKMVKVKLIRDGKEMVIEAKVGRRVGGFLLRDSFLDRIGIEVDENLYITRINSRSAGRFGELRVGDKLIWINRIPIENDIENINKILSRVSKEKELKMLINRYGLEIFIDL